ncbi:MAG TPA: sigma-70 family RNA polymerase sigma factor [Kofleriaceae bacterium]
MTTEFEQHRSFLFGLAYRILGSVTDAEDIVQDAFLRWRETDHSTIEQPRAYLARVVSRLCLDRMKSATARREHYVGMWLPEPLVTEPAAPLAEDLSVALLLTLERLSPLERAAFLLHDVFDMDYADVAAALERSEAACRQLAARAREHVRDARPRFAADTDAQTKLADAFHAALATGDLSTLAQLLADDAVLYSDSGGKRFVAYHPIHGKDKILKIFTRAAGKRAIPRPDQIERTWINGMPGFIVRTAEAIETIALESNGDRIAALYIVANPDKLKHLA